MKCHKHSSVDAVGTCVDCWVWLCQECVRAFTIPVCSKCNLVRLVNEKSAINSTFIKNTLIWILVGFYLFWMGFKQYHGTYWDPNIENKAMISWLIYLYFWFFIMYGWTFINSLKDPNSITVRVNEWIIALFIRKAFKFGFSCFIWGFVWPYQAWKMKQRLKTINETTKFIQTNA